MNKTDIFPPPLQTISQNVKRSHVIYNGLLGATEKHGLSLRKIYGNVYERAEKVGSAINTKDSTKGNVLFLKEAKEALIQLEAAQIRKDDLDLTEKKQAKALAAQKKAVEDRSGTLLVAAAAGSGKTAILTQRLIKSYTLRGSSICLN